MTNEELYIADQRSEEIQHIIERMPSKFGIWLSSIILLIFILLFIFGWVVRYPDVITGRINLTTQSSPLKLIANTNGKLKLSNLQSMDYVNGGKIIAYIESPTDLKSVLYIDSILKRYNPNDERIIELQSVLPKNLPLGELNSKYSAFKNALQEYSDYKKDKLADLKIQNLLDLVVEQRKIIDETSKRVGLAQTSAEYAHKFYARDSLLFVKKVISESEFDKTQMSYLSSRDALQNTTNNYINSRQTLQQTQGQIKQLGIEKPEKEGQLKMTLVSSYNDFEDTLIAWELKYVIRTPLSGNVQFLKFYNENQFVQAGEELFTIVRINGDLYGQVLLPAAGSGKIKAGQEVIVKLDNYPYMEYGSISGQIKSISITTSTSKTPKEDLEIYQVLVTFPNQLKTNYGTKLDFRAEAKGSAEIITNDRRLIQRFFDNLKYAVKK